MLRPKKRETTVAGAESVRELAGLGPWQADMPARRRYRRWATNFQAFVDAAGQSYPCRVIDISPGGTRLCLVEAADFASGAEVVFDLDGWGEIQALVRHQAPDVLGLEFLLLEGEEVLLARWLLAHRPERRQDRRNCSIAASLHWAGREFACEVVDLSDTGARVEVADPRGPAPSSEVVLAMPGRTAVAATVRHVIGRRVGLRFLAVLEGALPLD